MEEIIQNQDWSNYNRYFIIHKHGSVCLDLYPEKQESFGGTAYIWNLFVSKESRHKGIGKMLLDKAELLARQAGHKAVVMEWDSKDTAREILDWYLRSGYEVIGHYREVQYMLEKKL